MDQDDETYAIQERMLDKISSLKREIKDRERIFAHTLEAGLEREGRLRAELGRLREALEKIKKLPKEDSPTPIPWEIARQALDETTSHET